MRLGCVNLVFGSRGRKGLTLLEVVIALSIYMVASTAICVLITQSNRLSDSARDHYVAVNLAKNRMERARNMPYSTLYMLDESNLCMNVAGTVMSGPKNEAVAIYRRTTDVVTNLPIGSNITEVIVTVEIRDRDSWEFRGIKEVVRTYFTEYQTP